MKKEAAGDFSHLKNKKGELIAQPLPQPTLPNVSLDDEEDAGSMRSRGPAPGAYGGGKEYGLDYPPMDYPPMPASTSNRTASATMRTTTTTPQWVRCPRTSSTMMTTTTARQPT